MEVIKIPIQVAALVMGKSVNFIRWGLQQERLPIGYAVKNPESLRDRYSYYINPRKLAEQTGRTIEELKDMAEAYRANEKTNRERRQAERIAGIRLYRKDA